MGFAAIISPSAKPTPLARHASPSLISPVPSSNVPCHTSHRTPATVSCRPVFLKLSLLSSPLSAFAFIRSAMGPIISAICLASSSVMTYAFFSLADTIVIVCASPSMIMAPDSRPPIPSSLILRPLVVWVKVEILPSSSCCLNVMTPSKPV